MIETCTTAWSAYRELERRTDDDDSEMTFDEWQTIVYSLVDLLKVLEVALSGCDQIQAVLVILDLNICFAQFGSFRNHPRVWGAEQVISTFTSYLQRNYA